MNNRRKHDNAFQNRKLTPGPLVPQSGVLPLGHRVNETYR